MFPSQPLLERSTRPARWIPAGELGSLAAVAGGIAATFAATLGLVWLFLLLTF